MEIKNIVVVLGNKMPNGIMDCELKQRCDLAFARVTENSQPSTWAIVLTGGVTTLGKPAEADIAREYLSKKPQTSSSAEVTMFCEGLSKTTPENILCTLDILRDKNITPGHVVIMGRKSQIPKVRIIVNKLWDCGQPTFEYVSGIDLMPWWYQWVDLIIMRCVSWFDPRGDSLALLKKISRNG